MSWSLSARLLVAAGMVLAGFFGVTGVVLDRAYYRSAESALRERLQNYAYTLIAASEIDASGAVQVAYPVPGTRFFQPDSGVYARIVRNDGRFVWLAPSMGSTDVPFPRGLHRSQHRFDTVKSSDGARLLGFHIGVAWDGDASRDEVYTVSVAQDLTAFNSQIASYRRTLWLWLGVVAVILLIVQSVILRWGLAPLRRAAADLIAIERGSKTELDEDYPRELRGLTANLNALVRNERERRERYRRVLGDLAHSLKTPLAVLRGVCESDRPAAGLRAAVDDQVGRMSDIVEHQLQRAAATGHSALQAGTPVEPVIRQVVDALEKVYGGKDVHCRVETDPEIRFDGDKGDLMEVLGNLLDNAYKWCRKDVHVEIRDAGPRPQGGRALGIRVADDGPGVAAAMRDGIWKRGIRADDPRGGQGIGLAIVQDMVALYGGRVSVGDSASGGALVEVVL